MIRQLHTSRDERYNSHAITTVSGDKITFLLSLFQRRGPQRSVSVIISSTFLLGICLVVITCVQVRIRRFVTYYRCSFGQILFPRTEHHQEMYMILDIILNMIYSRLSASQRE